MAWSIVQSVHSSTTASSLTVTSTGSKNLLVLIVGTSTNAQLTSVTDNATGGSNTYVNASATGSATVSANSLNIWYVINSRSGATTVTFSGNAKDYTFYEVSMDTSTQVLDVKAAASDQSGSATPTGVATTTTTANDFIVSAILANNGTMSGIHAGNEFTSDFISTNGVWGYAHITSTSATAASHNAQWDNSGSFAYCSVIAAFCPGARPADPFYLYHFGP